MSKILNIFNCFFDITLLYLTVLDKKCLTNLKDNVIMDNDDAYEK